MVKIVLLAGAMLMAFIADATCQRPHIILPTYRPPVQQGPVIRTARDVNDEPLWLWKEDNIDRAPTTADHPVLPSVIDDIKLDPHRRYTRSKDSPSANSYGGAHSSSGGSRDTGPTHPGYNRRNARSLNLPDFDFEPLRPYLPPPFNPTRPNSPFDPTRPRGPFPIYARTVRDIQFPGVKKPSYRDVIIPNWNPNVRTNPWNSLGGRRKTRSLDNPGKEDELFNDYYDVMIQE